MYKSAGLISNSYHRRILENHLHKNKHLISGNVIDIGSAYRRYDHLFNANITAVDLNADERINVIYGNIQEGLPFEDNAFDGVLCFEVLEFVDQYEKAVKEIHRLLKKGGFALISYPFMYSEHQDRIRLTEGMFKSVLKDFSSVQSYRVGNGYIVMWDILRYKAFAVKNKLLRYFSLGMILPVLGTIKLLKLENKKDDFYSGLFFVIQK